MKGFFGWVSGACLALTLWTGTSIAAEKADAIDPAAIKQAVDDYLSAAAAEGQDPHTFRAYWSSGLKFESNDGNFKLGIGGRLMWDNYWMSSDDYNSATTVDRSYFRRIRFFIDGTVYKNVIFKVQLDFAGQQEFLTSASVTGQDTNGDGNIDTITGSTSSGKVGDVAIKDVYMGLKNIPGLGTFKAGHFHEPFCLEELTSSKYITFIERSAPTNAFAPSRNAGIGFENGILDKRMSWAIGVYRDVDDQGRHSEDGAYNVTLRVTGLALQSDEQYLHLGVGFSYRTPNGGSVRYRARPGTGSGPRLVDTRGIAADRVTLVNLEALYSWKMVHVQGEYFLSTVTAPDAAPGAAQGPEPDFSGYYVEIGWWITGEHLGYKGNKRDRTKPKKNFFDGSGAWGAWMLAIRFDSLDLTDSGIAGGEQDTVTVGVNWHWNPNSRVMFNYINADVTNGPTSGLEAGKTEGKVNVFEIRFQFDF